MLIPLQRNDGTDIPDETLGEAVFEILDYYQGVSFENTNVIGHWQHEGVLYRDSLARLVIDVPDTAKNRKWMKRFKNRWKEKLDQLDLWMVSYRIDIE